VSEHTGDREQVNNAGLLPAPGTGDLDLRAVRYFLVLAEELHFGRAARRLDLSRSGLSRSISALEAQLARVLLVRSSRGVALTPAGERLAARGRALLRMQGDLLSELGRGQNGSGGSGEPKDGSP
jgi:DNA-binding transcriptional LysR family regulator